MNYARAKSLLNNIMYYDRVTVLRNMPNTANDDDDYVPTAVYTDIPCKLAQKTPEVMTVADRNVQLQIDYRVCCDTQYDIQPNDILKVITGHGQHFLLNAGKAFLYPTHQEVPAHKKVDA
jgi:hypothetical protein